MLVSRADKIILSLVEEKSLVECRLQTTLLSMLSCPYGSSMKTKKCKAVAKSKVSQIFLADEPDHTQIGLSLLTADN